MSFLQPLMLIAIPLIAIPIIIHLINQRRYQTMPWAAMMFLLQATKMARGYARLRQWLILAARCLVVAGLLVAVARPLASGLLGWTAGGRPDTTMVLLDRSPSMQETGLTGQSKLDTGRRQLSSALRTLGSSNWVLIESTQIEPQRFESINALVDSPSINGSSASADIPAMLQATVEYIQNNQPGATEVWICSDLRESDWNVNSANWAAVRDTVAGLPQSVRFHLLAYPDQDPANLAIRVTDARRVKVPDGNALSLSIQLSRQSDRPESVVTVPVQIEINGARREIEIDLTGSQTELKNHLIALADDQQRGWGRVSIPSDANNSDNDYYFVFDDPPVRHVVIVGDNRPASRALEIAASIAPDGSSTANVDFVSADDLDSLMLDDAALLLWHDELPGEQTRGVVTEYVGRGGQVIFFPPESLLDAVGSPASNTFLGVQWGTWVASDNQVMVEHWRGDQDLLAATQSGVGLPVGQLEIRGYAKLSGEFSQLAALTGGDPLMARVPTERGGVYFCAASPSSERSSLGDNGIVLYVAIQRAIEKGLDSLGQTTQRVAGAASQPTDSWRQLAGSPDALSSEYSSSAGVYRVGEQEDGQWLAVNRSLREDRRDSIDDAQLNRLFAGLDFTRVDDSAGSLSGIVREVSRAFLILMVLAMIGEAILCIPRRGARKPAESAPRFMPGPNRPGEAV